MAPSVPARSILARLTSTPTIRPRPGEHGAHHARQADAPEADHRDRRPRRDLGRLDAPPRRPVDTPQPMSAATSGGTPSGIGTTARRRARPGPWPSSRSRGRRGPASRRRATRRVVPSACAWRSDGEPEHSHWRPRWHSRQRRQGAYHDRATARPTNARVQARPDGLDHARALVPQDDRPRPLPVAVADVEVGVADARRRHPDEDLARRAGRRAAASRSTRRSPARSMTAASISRMALPMPDPPGERQPVFWSPAAMPLIVDADDASGAGGLVGRREVRRPEPPEQLHLDGRQGVDVGVAELDRPGERGVGRRAAGPGRSRGAAGGPSGRTPPRSCPGSPRASAPVARSA